MQGHTPLTDADPRTAVGAYADQLLTADVQARNAFANAMLAWAEDDSAETFFGPDIPQTIARIYDKGLKRLMGSAQDPRGAG